MKELPSNFKTNILMHPVKSKNLYGIANIQDTNKIITLINQLSENALKDEHDVVYLIETMKLIIELNDKNPLKHILMNAVSSQLCNYLTGCIEMTYIISIALHLFNGSPSAIVWPAINILIIESINTNLQILFKKNNDFNLTFLTSKFVMQLMRPDNYLDVPKNVIINTYEFAKSSASFFYHKVFNSQTVHYELPSELQESTNDLNSLRAFMRNGSD